MPFAQTPVGLTKNQLADTLFSFSQPWPHSCFEVETTDFTDWILHSAFI